MSAVVILTHRGEALHTLDRPGRWVIGRAADCAVRVRGGQGAEEVSRHHCVIEVDPPQVRVRDLGSLNGTYVNGVLIGRRPVHLSPEESDPASLPAFPVRDGDEIRVGDTVFRLRINNPQISQIPQIQI